MERLTSREYGETCLINEKGIIPCGSVCDEHDNCKTCPLQKAFDKLADYEDAEEQGLLLRLPVVFDKTIYVIEHGEIVEDTLFAVNQDVVGLWAIDTHGSLVGTFGTNVFASREEAESVLAEKGGAE